MKRIFFVIMAVVIGLVALQPTVERTSILLQLQSPDPTIKNAAIEAAETNGIKEALPHLLEILKQGDDDDEVIWRAAKSIGRIGRPEAIKPLLLVSERRSLSDLSWQTIINIVRQIDPDWTSRTEIQAVYPALLREFHETRNDRRRECLFHFLFLIDSRRSENLVLTAMENRECESICSDALEKIKELKKPEHFAPLIRLFKKWPCVWLLDRLIQCLDLLNCDWRNLPEMRRFADEIERGFSEGKQPEGKMDALEKLNALRPKVAAKYLLTIAGNERNTSSDRCHALTLLGETRCQEALPLFVKGLTGNQDIQRACIKGLGRLGNEKSAKFLIPLLQDPNFRTREKAIFALGESGTTKACQVLAEKLNRDPKDEAFEILQALFVLGEPRAFEWGRKLLNKSSDDLRYRCINLFMPYWKQDHFNEILGYYRKLDRSDNDYERILWIKTMAALKDPRALPVLEEAERDASRNIRAHAEWAIFHVTH